MRDISPIIDTSKFGTLLFSCQILNSSYLATFSRRFPVFLTPSPDFTVELLRTAKKVRIRWDNQSWYIYHNQTKLFSFDIPIELFSLYEHEGLLSPRKSLKLKEEMMSEIQLILYNERNQQQDHVEIKHLYLDNDWVNEIKERIQSEEKNIF